MVFSPWDMTDHHNKYPQYHPPAKHDSEHVLTRLPVPGIAYATRYEVIDKQALEWLIIYNFLKPEQVFGDKLLPKEADLPPSIHK